MDARKTAAAISTAGMLLIAGCGGKPGGSSLPAVPGQVNRGTQPANTAKIALQFSIPSHASQAWSASTVFRKPSQRRVGTGRVAKEVSRNLSTRQPKYLSPAVLGGAVYVFIYQGANLALTDGPFSVGTTPSSDIYCYAAYGFPYVCYSNAPVFAPYGNDTFFVAMYDSQQRLLSITPGMPGTSFYPATQAAYTITPSGYPYPIAASTYAVVSTFGVDSATSCVLYDLSPAVATDLFDASGYFLTYGPLANPITVSVSGGFTLYETTAVSPYFAPAPSPYTIYDITGASQLFMVAQGPGAMGSISVTSSGSNALINGATPSMNLIAVDRLALSPGTGGLNALGLVDSSPAAYTCGTMYLAAYDTGAPITFSNPAAMGKDDFYPGAVVVDNVSGTPVASVFSLDPGLFGLGFETYRFQNAVPAVHGSLPGSNPLEVAVSPSSSGLGNSMVYVLNADGSISSISTSTGAIASVEPAGSVSGAAGIDVQYYFPVPSGTDSLLLTSSNSPNLYEIDSANSSPYMTTFSLTNASPAFSSSATSTAIAADTFDGSGAFVFNVNDPNNSPQNAVASCFYPCAFNSSTFWTYLGSTAEGVGTIGMADVGAAYAVAANGSQILGFYQFYDSPPQLAGVYATLGSAVTRIISTYDGAWSGVAYGSAFIFNYQLGGATVYSPSLPGTRAVIVSP